MKLPVQTHETTRRQVPPKPPRRGAGAWLLLCVAAGLAAAALAAQAQPCDGSAPPTAKVQAPQNSEKFRLIAERCQVTTGPALVHRAAQLDLYDSRPSMTIQMPAPQLAPRTEAPAAPPISIAPPSRDAARVLSLNPALTAAALAHDVDPLLLHAVAHVESRHNTRAVSPAGARGVMQVMPDTARRFGVTDPERSLFDAETNLRASAALLRSLRSRYGDDLRLVLAAYNAGEGAVDKHGRNVPPYPETEAYVRDVLAVYRRLSASFEVTATGTLVARGEKS